MSLCISKFHSLISPLISSEKSLSIGKLSSSLGLMWVFQNSYFHWKAPILSLVTIVSIVFLEVTVLLHSFLRKYLPNTQIWIPQSICHSFKEKWCSPQNMISSTPKTNSGTKVLFQNNNILRYTKEVLYGYFSFITWSIKKIFTQGMGFNKSNVSSGTFLNETSFFFL